MSFLTLHTILKLASDEGDKFSPAKSALLLVVYLDDLLTDAPSVDCMQELRCSSIGFSWRAVFTCRSGLPIALRFWKTWPILPEVEITSLRASGCHSSWSWLDQPISHFRFRISFTFAQPLSLPDTPLWLKGFMFPKDSSYSPISLKLFLISSALATSLKNWNSWSFYFLFSIVITGLF